MFKGPASPEKRVVCKDMKSCQVGSLQTLFLSKGNFQSFSFFFGRFSRWGPYEYILLFLPGWFAVGDRIQTGSMTPPAPWREEQLKQFASITGKPRCFPCPDCDKSFPRKSELKRHYMIHTGVKPYKCQFCDQSFRQRPHIKRHLYVHHHEQLIGGKVEISKLLWSGVTPWPIYYQGYNTFGGNWKSVNCYEVV